MIGKVLKKHGGFYIVETKNGLFECKLSGKQKHWQQDRIVAGDYVDFDIEDGNEFLHRGYITSVKKRTNYIPRPGIANIDQILIVAAIKEPSYDFFLLDKLIALSRYFSIDPTLCFSKMDLATSDEKNIVESYYRNTGIQLMFIGSGLSLEDLYGFCRGKTTVLTGNSGVGKSSLINRLLGKEVQEVQNISMKLNRGKNTTRTSEFFALEDGFIVDTPGFSALVFSKDMRKSDLKDLYPEYATEAKLCRFNNCVHINEPDCEIKRLVSQEYFSNERYLNYVKLYQELEEREKMRK